MGSRNYDNWERLVKAVLKRDKIWQLCHQDSINSSLFSDDSSDVGSNFRFSDVKPPAATPPSVRPVSLERLVISSTFKFAPQLRYATNIATLLQDVRVSDQKCFLKGSKAAVKILPTPVMVTKHEFEQQMILLGMCSHENVGQPLAYYFSAEDRKLIVYEYYSQGSVSDMLRGAGSGPDWESRLRIAVGAARGIAHIHTQRGGTLAHGNIKSSNIFLNSQHYGCVSDFGLENILKLRLRESGRKVELKSLQMNDVYSFGLLLLELVIRRKLFEELVHYFTQFYKPYYEWKGAHWIAAINNESSHRIVVDELDIKIFGIPHEDMYDEDKQKTLWIAKSCLKSSPENRPRMSDVVLMLHNILKITSDENHIRERSMAALAAQEIFASGGCTVM